MPAPKIVAELSANHRGLLTNALRLVAAAKAAGADAVKLQVYQADRMTIDHDGPGFTIERGPWAGQSLFDLYRQAQTPYEWLPKLFGFARRIGIECFASVFDVEAVAMLEQLECPAYKIASFEIGDLALIRRAAATRKPVIISTGMASDSEIADALDAAHQAKTRTLLHCISAYPALPAEANLQRIGALRQRFAVPVGISDHSLGPVAPVAAAALGAVMIERHLTLSRADGGPDAAFSTEPAEFKAMADMARLAASAIERPAKPAEPYRDLKRSLYAVLDIGAGEEITARNVRSIRPGLGLTPKHLPGLLGKRAKAPIARGTPMGLDLVG